MQYNVPEVDAEDYCCGCLGGDATLGEIDEEIMDMKDLLATSEYSLKTAMIAGAMGISQKDIYIYFLIFTQVSCMMLLVFLPVYSRTSKAIEDYFSTPATGTGTTAGTTTGK